MTSKSRGKVPVPLMLADPKWPFSLSLDLLVYTALTFFVIFVIYAVTKDWKGFTSPEEVDLGVVRVPSHTCRRKYGHHRRY